MISIVGASITCCAFHGDLCDAPPPILLPFATAVLQTRIESRVTLPSWGGAMLIAPSGMSVRTLLATLQKSYKAGGITGQVLNP